VESTWLKHFVMHYVQKVVFPSKKNCFHNRFYLIWWKRQNNVLPKLKKCCSLVANFDLWICKGAHDVFALRISFWGMD
jgi:hypothetical protein